VTLLDTNKICYLWA